MGETRQPIKKNAISKKNRIIEKGFELMCEKGYYNVSCKDIALYSNVSVGIIYQYFNDKKDIFYDGIKNYAENIMFPIIKEFDDNLEKMNLNEIIEKMLDTFVKAHKAYKSYHEGVLAMSHFDDEVEQLLYNSETKATKLISKIIRKNKSTLTNVEEKSNILIGIIDNYCHEVIYHKHSELKYETMKKEVTKTIKFILEDIN